MELLVALLIAVIVVLAVVVANAAQTRAARARAERYTNVSTHLDIPRVLWTFWDGAVPHVVHACLDSWRRYNADYRIVLLTRGNLERYLPDVDFGAMPRAHDSPARFSDFVRLNVLARYGGVWMDASIICNAPLAWLHALQRENRAEFVAYYNVSFTTEKWAQKARVIDSWFLACVPGSPFVRDWCAEFNRVNAFGSIAEYLADAARTTDFQAIEGVDYLTIHVAAQVVQQRAAPGQYALHLIPVEGAAFKYLADQDECVRDISRGFYAGTTCGWNVHKGLARLLSGAYDDQPIVKLRSAERWVIERERPGEIDALFKHARGVAARVRAPATPGVPRVIWTFWDGDRMPAFVHLCLDTWRRWNPAIDIVVLTRASLPRYLPDAADLLALRHAQDTPARFSDVLRLELLMRYGGVWMDASTICSEKLDFLFQEADFIGYRADQHMHGRPVVTVLESGVLASPPGSAFVTAWRDEFRRIHEFPTVADYVSAFRAQGIEYYGPAHPYWAVYMAQVWALARAPALLANARLLDASKTIYAYQFDPAAPEHPDQVRSLYARAPGAPRQALVKLTHYERDLIERDYPDVTPFFD